MTDPRSVPHARIQTSIILSLLVAFLATIGAYVFLVHHDEDATGLVSAIVTILGLLGVSTHAEMRGRRQDRQLSGIAYQTNGALDGRIREAVKAALDDHVNNIATPTRRK